MDKNKYNAQIFPNGHVIIFEQSILDEAIEKGKEILLVCVNTDGGYAYAIGAEPFEDGLHLYTNTIDNSIFTPEDYSRFYRIIIDWGESIIMASGFPATSYRFGYFIDDKSEIVDYNKALFRKFVDAEQTVKALTVKHIDGDIENERDIEDWKERVWALIRYGIVSEDDLKYCVEEEEDEDEEED